MVLPISFFERANLAYYNSIAIADADGAVLGVYRKSHIPDGPGYQEKFYFRPGDTGFKVWPTRFGRIGVGICWDQWFPETARCMALLGAELLFYPTAIGSEPQDPSLDSRDHWQRVMQGHAGANLVPLIASNRWGVEQGETCEATYYGSSFIAGPHGRETAGGGARGGCGAGAEFRSGRHCAAAGWVGGFSRSAAGVVWRNCYRGWEVRKVFFLERKNQRTFVCRFRGVRNYR